MCHIRALSRSPVICCLVLVFVTACSPKTSFQAMANQPRYEPYEGSDTLKNGQSAQPIVPGTVPRGSLEDDGLLYTGKAADGTLTEVFPFPITTEALRRGQERYNIYCTPCHGAVGDGQGIVVQRGYSRPPSFHADRLRDAPIGYFFDVITNGFGAMPSYAEQMVVRDRWAVIAYIRALQLSQHATLDDVPPEARDQLQTGSGQP